MKDPVWIERETATENSTVYDIIRVEAALAGWYDEDIELRDISIVERITVYANGLSSLEQTGEHTDLTELELADVRSMLAARAYSGEVADV